MMGPKSFGYVIHVYLWGVAGRAITHARPSGKPWEKTPCGLLLDQRFVGVSGSVAESIGRWCRRCFPHG